jgi:methanogenic corrinoid protein MtbC1
MNAGVHMDLHNSLSEDGGQTPIWLMAAGGSASKQSGSADRGHAKDDRDACQASVLEILESQIIPSLLKATAHSLPFISTDGTRRTLPTAQEIANFAEICISSDPDLPDAFVQGLMAEGLTAESLFLHLLTPAARHLGYLWDEDLCDFTKVTVGLIRMQQITLRLGRDFQEQRKSPMSGRRAMFAPVPGSQHTLGVLMVSEFFRREGWQVWMELGSSEHQLVSAAKKDWFDVIGLSIGTEAHAEYLADIIAELRVSSSNPNVKVLIGGPALATTPHLRQTVGADGAASDAVSAIELAKRIVVAPEASAPMASPAAAVTINSSIATVRSVMAEFRQFRKSRGITLKDAADQLSIGYASLTKYELLDRHPKADVLEKIRRWMISVDNQSSRVVKKR